MQRTEVTLASPPVTVRRVSSIEECRDLEAVMAAIWGPEGVVPYHMTFKMARYGGVVLGAYTGQQMVGFVLSFPMFQNGRSGLYLHLLGVLAKWRSSRAGIQLMLELGKEALVAGYPLVAWTYDPLEGPLASLYLGRLGAICNAYQANYYGAGGERASRGVASDRFLAEWWLRSPTIANLLAQQVSETGSDTPAAAGQEPGWPDLTAVNGIEGYNGVLPIGSNPRLDLSDPELLLYIPGDFPALKRADLSLACRWRDQTRTAFQHYFEKGYYAVGCIPRQSGHAYLLRRGVPQETIAAMHE